LEGSKKQNAARCRICKLHFSDEDNKLFDLYEKDNDAKDPDMINVLCEAENDGNP